MINDSTISAHLIKENYYFFVLYISFPLELIAFSLLFPVPAVCEWFEQQTMGERFVFSDNIYFNKIKYIQHDYKIAILYIFIC